jgi:SAM-dependent methyltransferase
MLSRERWRREVQHFEAGWWGDCANTYGEETKQIAYARVMDLDPGPWRGGDHWPIWDFGGLTVIDVGGGPSSMLLKSRFEDAAVIDPCPYPEWVAARYLAHGVRYNQQPAEDALAAYDDGAVDVALCYNVLQHTMDPERICREMRRAAGRVHIFEWVDQAPHPGHPHELKADLLAGWFGGPGRHVWVDETYQEIGPDSDAPVRQHAWGGVFE